MSVNVYTQGPFYCSVCVPEGWDRARVEREVNLANPSGTENGWFVAKDPTFKGGQPNPCECDDDPKRRHWLMDC